MSLPWIVQGDGTSHGGTVIEGDPTFTTHGKPVAHVGHMVTCPRCKGGPFPIVTGAPDFINNGKAVARHGDKTACGASLISGQVSSRWGDESAPGKTQNITQPVESLPGYDEHFVLKDKSTGKPMVGFAYGIESASGSQEGVTGDDGKTCYIRSDKPQPVTLTYIAQQQIGVRE